MGEISSGEDALAEVSSEEVNEAAENTEVEEMDDELSQELDDVYDRYVETKDAVDNPEDKVEKIKCRNENLAGLRHPETDVPFEKKEVDVDGKKYEVVVPEFESIYDAQLPEDKLKSSDPVQFKECNVQLKEEVAHNKELREKFDEEQLEQIEDGETPDGYTWHHDAEAGKMQLVDFETHQKTGHTGGRYIWGGGTENR